MKEFIEGDRVLTPGDQRATVVKAGMLICEVYFDEGEPSHWWFAKRELQHLEEGAACDARVAAA